jgi:hypothetical protein
MSLNSARLHSQAALHRPMADAIVRVKWSVARTAARGRISK